MVAGPKNVFICNECNDLCTEIFADERIQREATGHTGRSLRLKSVSRFFSEAERRTSRRGPNRKEPRSRL